MSVFRINHADGSEFLALPAETLDTVSTSLDLSGHNFRQWGPAYNNNFVKLLENFMFFKLSRSLSIHLNYFFC